MLPPPSWMYRAGVSVTSRCRLDPLSRGASVQNSEFTFALLVLASNILIFCAYAVTLQHTIQWDDQEFSAQRNREVFSHRLKGGNSAQPRCKARPATLRVKHCLQTRSNECSRMEVAFVNWRSRWPLRGQR